MVALVGAHEIFFQNNVRCVHFEAQRSQWRKRVKIWGEGGGMNWQEAGTDGNCEAEPVGLVSERRPVILADGNLCPWQGWTPCSYLKTTV